VDEETANVLNISETDCVPCEVLAEAEETVNDLNINTEHV
jgi:hypothetical protein